VFSARVKALVFGARLNWVRFMLHAPSGTQTGARAPMSAETTALWSKIPATLVLVLEKGHPTKEKGDKPSTMVA